MRGRESPSASRSVQWSKRQRLHRNHGSKLFPPPSSNGELVPKHHPPSRWQPGYAPEIVTTVHTTLWDSRRGQPLVGATLEVVAEFQGARSVVASAMSDALGRATCGLVLACAQTVTMRAKVGDLVVAESPVAITSQDSGSIVSADLHLASPTSLTTLAIDVKCSLRGDPLPGSTVLVVKRDLASSSSMSSSPALALIDGDTPPSEAWFEACGFSGLVNAELTDSSSLEATVAYSATDSWEVFVWAFAPGRRPASSHLVLDSDSASKTVPVELTLSPSIHTWVLRLQVTDQATTGPLPDTKVAVRLNDGSDGMILSRTGVDGVGGVSFQVPVSEPDRPIPVLLTVQATHPGYAPVEMTIRGANEAAALVMEPARDSWSSAVWLYDSMDDHLRQIGRVKASSRPAVGAFRELHLAAALAPTGRAADLLVRLSGSGQGGPVVGAWLSLEHDSKELVRVQSNFGGTAMATLFIESSADGGEWVMNVRHPDHVPMSVALVPVTVKAPVGEKRRDQVVFQPSPGVWVYTASGVGVELPDPAPLSIPEYLRSLKLVTSPVGSALVGALSSDSAFFEWQELVASSETAGYDGDGTAVVQELHGDDDVVQELHGDDDVVQELHGDDDVVQELHGDDDVVQELHEDGAEPPNGMTGEWLTSEDLDEFALGSTGSLNPILRLQKRAALVERYGSAVVKVSCLPSEFSVASCGPDSRARGVLLALARLPEAACTVFLWVGNPSTLATKWLLHGPDLALRSTRLLGGALRLALNWSLQQARWELSRQHGLLVPCAWRWGLPTASIVHSLRTNRELRRSGQLPLRWAGCRGSPQSCPVPVLPADTLDVVDTAVAASHLSFCQGSPVVPWSLETSVRVCDLLQAWGWVAHLKRADSPLGLLLVPVDESGVEIPTAPWAIGPSRAQATKLVVDTGTDAGRDVGLVSLTANVRPGTVFAVMGRGAGRFSPRVGPLGSGMPPLAGESVAGEEARGGADDMMDTLRSPEVRPVLIGASTTALEIGWPACVLARKSASVEYFVIVTRVSDEGVPGLPIEAASASGMPAQGSLDLSRLVALKLSQMEGSQEEGDDGDKCPPGWHPYRPGRPLVWLGKSQLQTAVQVFGPMSERRFLLRSFRGFALEPNQTFVFDVRVAMARTQPATKRRRAVRGKTRASTSTSGFELPPAQAGSNSHQSKRVQTPTRTSGFKPDADHLASLEVMGASVVQNVTALLGKCVPLTASTSSPPASVVLLHDRVWTRMPLLFEANSASLAPSAMVTLHDVADLLFSRPGLRLNLVGHAGPEEVGTEIGSKDLSVERASAVRSFLIDSGISPGRLKVLGVGASRPQFASKGADAPRNRRVELWLLSHAQYSAGNTTLARAMSSIKKEP
jgi:outer membrane protein OmpA-like peptidoglycan-associated protein